MEDLEAKIKQYRRSAINATLGVGICLLGSTIDDNEIQKKIMQLGGALYYGIHLRNAAKYADHLFDKYVCPLLDYLEKFKGDKSIKD